MRKIHGRFLAFSPPEVFVSHPFTTSDRSSIFFVPEIGALEDMKRWIGNHVFSGFTLSNKYIYISLYIDICTKKYISISISNCIYVNIHVYIYTRICMHVKLHIQYIHVHMYIHK